MKILKHIDMYSKIYQNTNRAMLNIGKTKREASKIANISAIKNTNKEYQKYIKAKIELITMKLKEEYKKGNQFQLLYKKLIDDKTLLSKVISFSYFDKKMFLYTLEIENEIKYIDFNKNSTIEKIKEDYIKEEKEKETPQWKISTNINDYKYDILFDSKGNIKVYSLSYLEGNFKDILEKTKKTTKRMEQ